MVNLKNRYYIHIEGGKALSKKQRIDKVLSNLGYGSRSELKKFCKNGLVKVNGKVINNPGVQVDVENDEIIFDGEKVTYKEFIYLMLNKPDGYISATFDKRDPIVLDLIDKERKSMQENIKNEKEVIDSDYDVMCDNTYRMCRCRCNCGFRKRWDRKGNS